MIKAIKEEFQKLSSLKRANHSQKYFKTGKGEYGEGDIFLGLRVPDVRKIARKYRTISIEIASEFLQSPFHEERLFALIVLVNHFKKADEKAKEKIY
ncbi:MAG: DNA alkylation repair protein, partial [Candidatus Atribacteria bacterium]|nr:DNA alkylation repair protein [Candidatus Atribacteria bacterium]